MKNLSLLGLAVLMFGCIGTIEEKVSTPEVDIAKELAAIEELRNSFTMAIKEGRYNDIGKHVTSDVITVRAGGQGWDEMFALGEERGRFPYDSIVMSPEETVLVSDSVAYDFGHSLVYYTNEDGEVVELTDTFLVILKKQEGEWKLHREVASSIIE